MFSRLFGKLPLSGRGIMTSSAIAARVKKVWGDVYSQTADQRLIVVAIESVSVRGGIESFWLSESAMKATKVCVGRVCPFSTSVERCLASSNTTLDCILDRHCSKRFGGVARRARCARTARHAIATQKSCSMLSSPLQREHACRLQCLMHPQAKRNR